MPNLNPSNLNLGPISLEAKSSTITELDGTIVARIITLQFNGPHGSVAIQLEAKDAIDLATQIFRLANHSEADASMLEAMHKSGIDPVLIQQVSNLSRMKRQAGNG